MELGGLSSRLFLLHETPDDPPFTFYDCCPRNCTSEQRSLTLLPPLARRRVHGVANRTPAPRLPRRHHDDLAPRNDRDPLPLQIAALNLSVPLKYIFIMHSPEQYLGLCAEIAAPFAKVCSIVQAKNMQMYGTAFIAKSLCYVWELLGTKLYYGVDVESHGGFCGS